LSARPRRALALLPVALTAVIFAAPAAAQSDLQALPLGQGLPILVRTGLYFAEVGGIDESEQTFEATIDLRLRWRDARLNYPAEETPKGFQDFRGPKAEEKLAQIWSPQITLSNLEGEPLLREKSLRIFPDGQIELMERTRGVYSMKFDVEAFPFDVQQLAVELVSLRDNQEQAKLDFRQEDVDFSRAASGIEVDGWTPGLVELRRSPREGWYGESHSQVRAYLEMRRRLGTSVAPIFIPLLASLLIPLTAIWMNKVNPDGSFEVEAFELANVIIGGLFAVIALNFTVNAEYSTIGSSDNTVTRLFGLNYITLAVALAIIIGLFRFGWAKRAFGAAVQEQLYLTLVWVVPLLVGATATAMLLVAMA
jgi:hypothetical protein